MKHNKLKIISLLAILFVFSCKSKVAPSKMKTPEHVLIAKGNLYGAGSEGITKQNTLIENQNDWDALMAQMNTVNKVSDSFEDTSIDFSKHAVIAVFEAVKGSGSHRLELDINTSSKPTVVTVKHLYPQGNASSVMTQPYYLVKIAKTQLPVLFQ